MVNVDNIRGFRPPYVWVKTFVFLPIMGRASTDRCFLYAYYGNPRMEILQEQLRKLPHGAVFLCHAKENTRQRRVLERVEAVFRQDGYAVTMFPMEQVV
jgi:hypothetical protein